jgi:Tetratricopeptide repeat
VILATVAWLAVGGAVLALLGPVVARLDLALLLSAGLLLPLGMLAAAVVSALGLRRSFSRREVRLKDGEVGVRPGLAHRMVKGTVQQTLALSKTRTIRLLATRDGVRLVLFGPDEDSPPLMLGLAQVEVVALIQAVGRAPDSAWDPGALAAVDELRARGEAVLALREPRPSGPLLAVTLRAAGLWQLAAEELWPTVLAHPDALDHALDLYGGERHRLGCVARMGLLQAMLTHHPQAPTLLLDYARLCLVLRNRPEAQAVLDRLVALDDPPAVGVHWRSVLREKRQVGAPPSKATFGIEVNLPSHRIDGDELVVEERWRVGLDWFVAYRLLAGFWGPPRRLLLIDIWGASHMLAGDALDWAARLERSAPHLCEVHDEGMVWPSVRARSRQLRRQA